MTNPTSDPRSGLRDLARSSVRDHLADQARRLFDERGFDATTVDDIAAAVGMSSRTFFRYFATKEDVVVEDPAPFGMVVRDAAAGRPDGESVWTTLRRAFDPVTDKAAAATESWLRAMRVMMSTASLRARNAEKHNAWAVMLEPVITARLDGPEDTRQYRARTLIQAALACLDIALAEWTHRGGTTPLDKLLDEAFATISNS
ncbi:TetR family transcriptional regulator [Streptomyces sp. NPDC005262]|uniref:TetR family transcriptional regulator n=1 Tax=Streptomyces sp. NPDC005262 TaxID=3364710 RepID=UPI0036BC353B